MFTIGKRELRDLYTLHLISLFILYYSRNENCSNDTEEQQIRVHKASFHAYVAMSNQYSQCISVIRLLDFAGDSEKVCGVRS